MPASKVRKGLDPLVYQLYKAAKSNTSNRRVREETLEVLAAATNAVKDSFTPDDLSVLAWSASKIGHTSPKFWKVAVNLTEVYAHEFSARSATRLLEAFSLARGSRDRRRPASALLGLFAEPPGEPLTEQGVCQLLRALVNLKMIDVIPTWLLQEGLRLLDEPPQSTTMVEPPRCLVPLMWPLSRIPTTAEMAASTVARLIRGGRVDYTRMTTTDAALLVHSLAKAWNTTEGVLWACGRCNIRSLMEECTEDWHPLMAVDLKSFDPQALANLLWGVGRINRRQLPCWIPVDDVQAAFAAQSSKADLFSVSMIACALAYEESCGVDEVFTSLWEFVRQQLLHRPSQLEEGAGDLAGLLWAFSRRGHLEAVLELSLICEGSLLSLPTDLRALAMWGMAHAGINLPEQLGRELLTSLHRPTASPPSSSVITSLVALDQLCPNLNAFLPANLQSIRAADLWRLLSIRNAPLQQRRDALALAVRKREEAPAYAAAYFARCLDPSAGFLPPAGIRLRLLRELTLSGLDKCPSRYLPALACHLTIILRQSISQRHRRECMSSVRIPAAVARLASASKKTQSERTKGSQPRLKGMFNAALLAIERDFSPEGLAKIAWSCAKLKHQDETFYLQLSQLASDNATSFSLHTVGLFLEPLALYQSPWPLSCIDTIMRQLAIMPEVNTVAGDLCRVLTALARLGSRPQLPEWIVLASLEMIRGGHPVRDPIAEAGIYGSHVQQVCWALARIPSTRVLIQKTLVDALISHNLVSSSPIHVVMIYDPLERPIGESCQPLLVQNAKCLLLQVQWPAWCSSVDLVMVSGQLPLMSLRDLAIIAPSLAKIEDDTVDGRVFDGIWDQLQNLPTDSFCIDRSDSSHLASIIWSFSWRRQTDRVRLLSSSVINFLPQLPAETQGIALWALANAGLRLTAQAAAEVQRSLLARPITPYTANALISLWVLRPSQKVVFPSTLNDFPLPDLWKLVSIRAAPSIERRRVLSLALRQRANVPPSAAAYYAGCLTTDEGFLRCTRLRLSLLSDILKVNLMSPKYLTKLACHLSELI
ncbi:hypothetical protein FOL47_010369 [Perkinsus chesapeaki]|uniref:Uncharacterized protein n=1 Tax=Perkinsus chesapeaki TaxID=330153 RepID=A0A7J6N1Q3_PERCH|nr:hypothetical protein FOL47_010369 [Perkinsus chesapeaki]